MAVKKKKLPGTTHSRPEEKSRSLSGAMTSRGSKPDEGNAVMNGISRSFYTLVDRTKAYFGSGKKAET